MMHRQLSLGPRSPSSERPLLTHPALKGQTGVHVRTLSCRCCTASTHTDGDRYVSSTPRREVKARVHYACLNTSARALKTNREKTTFTLCYLVCSRVNESRVHVSVNAPPAAAACKGLVASPSTDRSLMRNRFQ